MNQDTRPAFFAALVLFLLTLSCTFGPEGNVSRAIDSGDWTAASELLEPMVDGNPTNGALQRDLGRVRLELGDFDGALEALSVAADLSPHDRSIPLLLGLAHEGLGEWELAIEAYRSYPRSMGRTEIARSMRGRITRLIRNVYSERAKAAINEPEEMAANVLAVRYFDVLAEVETYGNLGKGLAEQLINDLSRVEGLHLVERLRFEALSGEIEKSRSEGFDPLAAVSIDAMLGAGWSLGGTITPLEGRDEIRFDYYLVNNITGEIGSPSSISGRLDDFFELEKRMVYAVTEELGFTLSREERQSIGEIPTTSFQAFLAYCDALAMEDKGEFATAGNLFDEAVRLDPVFFLALERSERTKGTREKVEAIARAELEAVSYNQRLRRLNSTASLLSPSPQLETGEADDLSGVRPLGLGSASVTVRVDEP